MTMRGLAARLVDAAHVVALALWVAALCAVGVAATGVFVMLPRIGVELPEFSPYVQSLGGDAAREHGRLAGGMVMQPVFRGAGWAEVVLGSVVVGTLAVQLVGFRARWPLRRPSNWLRAALIACAAALVCIQALDRGPRMDRLLTGAWSAARDGSFESANSARAEFELLHVRANLEFRTRLALLIAAIGLAAVAAVPGARAGCGEAAMAHDDRRAGRGAST